MLAGRYVSIFVSWHAVPLRVLATTAMYDVDGMLPWMAFCLVMLACPHVYLAAEVDLCLWFILFCFW